MRNLSVKEAIDEITVIKEGEGVNRFNKKKFDLLLGAIINDPEFKSEVAKVKNGEVIVDEISPTLKFRKWCKKLLESAGLDKAESKKVLSEEFQIESVDGLYEFFTSVLWCYLNDCNSAFDLPSKKDFKGSIYIKNVPEKTRRYKAFSPKDRSYIGEFEETKKAHKVLRASSNCPVFLKSRKPV